MLVPPTLAIRVQRRHLANASRSFLDLCHASLDLRGPSHARSVSRREVSLWRRARGASARRPWVRRWDVPRRVLYCGQIFFHATCHDSQRAVCKRTLKFFGFIPRRLHPSLNFARRGQNNGHRFRVGGVYLGVWLGGEKSIEVVGCLAF